MSLLNFSKKTDVKTASLPASLQTDTSRFKTILETIDDGVALVDGQQTIQMLNPGAAAICGWGADEASGIDFTNVLKLVDAKGVALNNIDNPIKQAFEKGNNIKVNDSILMSRENKAIPVSIRITPLLDDNKQVTAAVVVFTDVAQQRAQEQQRADFISTASHEMRTPVAAIEGYLALALNDKVSTIDSRARNYLEKAHASTEHLGQLFQDLLASAKAEDGRLISHPSIVEIGEFLEVLASDLNIIAEKKGLLLEFAVGSADAPIDARDTKMIRPLYYVYADPDRVREVLTNLFDNAVKYTPAGKITLGLTGNDQVVQCYVRDTGPGIPSADIPHLFQKFYRVDNSATRTIGGTGLGLFICRKIIELYSGRIWVESQLGHGSSFYINLPRLTNQKAGEIRNEINAGLKPSISATAT